MDTTKILGIGLIILCTVIAIIAQPSLAPRVIKKKQTDTQIPKHIQVHIDAALKKFKSMIPQKYAQAFVPPKFFMKGTGVTESAAHFETGKGIFIGRKDGNYRGNIIHELFHYFMSTKDRLAYSDIVDEILAMTFAEFAYPGDIEKHYKRSKERTLAELHATNPMWKTKYGTFRLNVKGYVPHNVIMYWQLRRVVVDLVTQKFPMTDYITLAVKEKSLVTFDGFIRYLHGNNFGYVQQRHTILQKTDDEYKAVVFYDVPGRKICFGVCHAGSNPRGPSQGYDYPHRYNVIPAHVIVSVTKVRTGVTEKIFEVRAKGYGHTVFKKELFESGDVLHIHAPEYDVRGYWEIK